MKRNVKKDWTKLVVTVMDVFLRAVGRMKEMALSGLADTICPARAPSPQDDEVFERWEQVTFCAISPDFDPPDALHCMRPVHRGRSKR